MRNSTPQPDIVDQWGLTRLIHPIDPVLFFSAARPKVWTPRPGR